MYGLLLAVLMLDGIFMSVVILLQSGKGGGLAAMGGAGGTAADNLIGSRQAATLLTKATWISGGIFVALSFVLAIMSTRARQPQSILGDEFQATPTAPTPLPVGGGAALPGAGDAGEGAGTGGDAGDTGGDAGGGGSDAGGGDAGNAGAGGGGGGGGLTLDGPGARP